MRALILVLVLTGCAQPVSWTAPKGTDRKADLYACDRDTRQSGPWHTRSQMQRFYDSCLEARGWTKTARS